MAIFKPADILIPQNVDFTKWSVVACDQYTSEREYWEDVKNIVGDSPSTLNIIFPEVYLEDGDGDERIKKINSTMEEYINQGIFRELKDSFIYVKRTQPNGKTRHGIVGMLDLEEYDFSGNYKVKKQRVFRRYIRIYIEKRMPVLYRKTKFSLLYWESFPPLPGSPSVSIALVKARKNFCIKYIYVLT